MTPPATMQSAAMRWGYPHPRAGEGAHDPGGETSDRPAAQNQR
jgi:hypothetical protein